MNMKLVIVWAFAIVIIAGAGLVGYVGKTTLDVEKPSDSEFQVKKDYTDHTCNGYNKNAKVAYNFAVLEDGSIRKMSIEYQSNAQSPRLDAAAESLKGKSTTGLEVSYNFDSEKRFKLVAYITPSTLTDSTVQNAKADADDLIIYINNTKDYATYKTAVENLGNYTCN